MPVSRGAEVPTATKIERKSNDVDPRYSINSLELMLYFTMYCKIPLIRNEYTIIAIVIAIKTKNSNIQYRTMPGSTNECTEVSPSTPLLVKKVE